MNAGIKSVNTLSKRLHAFGEAAGNLLVDSFHLLALFAIGGTIVWAAVLAFQGMVEGGVATIEDILLLFIYLELGAMVGIYFKTNHMPVRFLIYVAMTALTRLLIGSVNVEHVVDTRILIVTVAILILALAVLVVRYGSSRFSPGESKARDDNAETAHQA
ncbi:MAG: phosphate-starvation-inducible PsiE family protein [Proteobacteria bacterium]|nr:phosphate-starvation-inducible PsiE family protein [Pseudomonadota bacterium]